MTRFQVLGVACPQGSKSFYGNGRMKESSKGLPAWREQVAEIAALAHGDNPPIDSPATVTATFYLPKPKTTKFKEYPAGPPDTDKLQRAIGDALTKSKVITDDSRIIQWVATKRWATDAPYTDIEITDFTEREGNELW